MLEYTYQRGERRCMAERMMRLDGRLFTVFVLSADAWAVDLDYLTAIPSFRVVRSSSTSACDADTACILAAGLVHVCDLSR